MKQNKQMYDLTETTLDQRVQLLEMEFARFADVIDQMCETLEKLVEQEGAK